MNDMTELTSYEFLGYHLPFQIISGLKRYIEERIKPGHFLTAVIRNDLSEAFGRADHECLTNLPAIVAYFYNEAPSACWGSPEKMEKWLESGKSK